jgi:hypothetical protein
MRSASWPVLVSHLSIETCLTLSASNNAQFDLLLTSEKTDQAIMKCGSCQKHNNVKRTRRGSTSWEAYQYLRDRVHDAWLPDSARQQLRRIIKRIQVQIYQRREYGYMHEGS